MNHIESKVKIFTTKDYGWFKTIDGNRELKKSKVEKLLNSINDNLNMLPYCPILVDKNGYIYDGQHRFESAKQSGQPLSYIIIPNLDLSDVAEINYNMDKWSVEDCVYSFAKQGNPDFKKLVQLKEKYDLSFSIISEATSNDISRISDSLRYGTFKISNEELGIEILDHYVQIIAVMPSLKIMAIFRALKNIMKKSKAGEVSYKPKRMIEKLNIYRKKGKITHPFDNIPNNIRLLEQIYNYGANEFVKIA